MHDATPPSPSPAHQLRRPFKLPPRQGQPGSTGNGMAGGGEGARPDAGSGAAKAVGQRAGLAPLQAGAGSSPHPTSGGDLNATNPPPAAGGRAARGQAPLDRDQILDATAACLDQSGYDGTTIRRIAARLQCAVGSIYRYFTDKRELLSAVTQRRFESVVQAAQDGEGIEENTQRYLRTAAARPEQYRLMFWLATVGRAPDQPVALPEVLQTLLDAWARPEAAGGLGDRDAAEAHWAQLQGELMLGRHEHLRQDAGEEAHARGAEAEHAGAGGHAAG